MDPVNGILAHLWKFFGAQPLEWLSRGVASISDYPDRLMAMAAFCDADLVDSRCSRWTASSLRRQKWMERRSLEAVLASLFCLTLAVRSRLSILIQTIFLLAIFAEIFVTTQVIAFGTKTLSYLIFQRVLESQNVGLGSAGGVYAIILANIVAIFPDAHRRQEFGRVREIETWPAQSPTQRKTSRTPLSAWAHWSADLLSDPVDHLDLASRPRHTAINDPPIFLFFDWTLENYAIVQETLRLHEASCGTP